MVDYRFLDTNILLRYFTRDDEKAQRALALLRRVEQGQEQGETLPTVISETIYTLQSFYKVPRPQLRELILPILQMRGLRLARKDILRQALDLYVEREGLSFVDAYHAAYLRLRGGAEIYSWDTDLTGFPALPA